MFRRARLWVPATLLGLAGGTGVFAAHPGSRLCPAPAPDCPTPPARVVVEMSPPEVTFKEAAPACVRAPAPCKPTLHCFPVTFPGAPLPTAAPPVQMAPVQYAPVQMAPVQYAPTYAPAPVMPVAAAPAFGYPVAPAAYPVAAAPAPVPLMAPPPAFGPPPCGSSAGVPPGAGLGLPPAADLEAMLARQRAFEEIDLRLKHAALQKQATDVNAAMAARGLSPAGPGATGTAPRGVGAAPAGDQIQQQIDDLRKDVRDLQSRMQLMEGKVDKLQETVVNIGNTVLEHRKAFQQGGVKFPEKP